MDRGLALSVVGPDLPRITALPRLESVPSRATAFAETNPALAVALGVAVVAVAVALVLLVRHLRRPAGVRFRRLLDERDEIAVLMHPNPDPDAMAAAVGVAELARVADTDVTLQFPGAIRHQENRAFRTVLDLDLDAIDHVTDLAAESVVLVDHNEPRGFTGSDGVLPFAVVDHHPGDGTGEAFTDVRTDYGACATIVAEYFDDIGARPVPPDQHASEVGSPVALPSRTATGLLYGILTDTNHLTAGCAAADFDASGYLFAGVDEDSLDRIANPQVSAEVLEVKARAIAGRRVRGSFAVSDVGTVSNVDALPQAADELIRLEGVTAVVVCGEHDGTLHLSGRSRDDRVHMGRALETVCEEVPNASAGGHARMGGGQVAPPGGGLDAVTDGDVPDRTNGLPGREALLERVFESLTGDV